MKNVFINCLTILFVSSFSAQCTSDYDFGILEFGISPNPSLGESLESGIINEPYEDIIHFLVPQYVLDIDSTLPFSPTTPLDSLQLISIVMVDLDDTLSTYSMTDLGLTLSCNNNGVSGNSCSFLGGDQYCVDIYGTPLMTGNYRADLTIKGYVTIFGFPYGEEQLFGSLNLSISEPNLQCSYDFGDVEFGISPNPTLGESFESGLINEPYEDILHFLVPQYVLDIDSTLPFSPTTPLDSLQLISIVMVDLDDTLTSYTMGELGLEITCNNNGDSGNSCSFLGSNQYCVDIHGTPTLSGHFRADITVKGYVTIFGFPYGEEQLFGSLNLSIGTEGCMDESAPNYDPEAVVDDGSCIDPVGCFGDLNDDNSVTVSDVLTILAEFGCSSNCTTDLNGDGNTTVADLLELLSVFGTLC